MPLTNANPNSPPRHRLQGKISSLSRTFSQHNEPPPSQRHNYTLYDQDSDEWGRDLWPDTPPKKQPISKLAKPRDSGVSVSSLKEEKAGTMNNALKKELPRSAVVSNSIATRGFGNGSGGGSGGGSTNSRSSQLFSSSYNRASTSTSATGPNFTRGISRTPSFEVLSQDSKKRKSGLFESITSGKMDHPNKRRAVADGNGGNGSSGGAFTTLPALGASGKDGLVQKNARVISNADVSIRAKVILSPEQQRVLQLVTEGKNVFFTGSAGTGKSLLLREIISTLKRKHKPDHVIVTASTGMAACNVGGMTIHSFAGIGLGEGSAEDLLKKVRKNRNACVRWYKVKVLIIDEVSMLEASLFDKLEYIARELRCKANICKDKNTKFGGIQLVITGDFFQLPPVVKGGTVSFCFEAKTWKTCIDETVNLTQVFRQKDTEFVDILNEMRYGKLSSQSIEKFRRLSRVVKYDDGIEPTELFARREEVERSNQSRLYNLEGESKTYRAEDSGTETEPQRTRMLDNMMAISNLTLKIGAQVMLIKNVDVERDLCNGAVGTVIAFKDPLEKDSDNDSDDEQGDFGDASAIDGKPIPAAKAKKARAGELLPYVEFRTSRGAIREIIFREEFKIEDVDGKHVKAKRKQLPIVLAWAMSIHKSQGQTIERVKVDLGKVFEKGQSYVALSRAVSLESLQVLRFDPKKVVAHPKVIEWTRSISQA